VLSSLRDVVLSCCRAVVRVPRPEKRFHFEFVWDFEFGIWDFRPLAGGFEFGILNLFGIWNFGF